MQKMHLVMAVSLPKYAGFVSFWLQLNFIIILKFQFILILGSNGVKS